MLVVQLGAAAGLVGRRGGDPHVRAEGQATIGRPGMKDVRAQVRRVVAGVVSGQVHLAVERVDAEPLSNWLFATPAASSFTRSGAAQVLPPSQEKYPRIQARRLAR